MSDMWDEVVRWDAITEQEVNKWFRGIVRKAINNYDKRMARYLAFQLGEEYNNILWLINNMEDNKER